MNPLIEIHLGKNCTGIVMDYLTDLPKLPFLVELLEMRLWLNVLYSRRGSNMLPANIRYVRLLTGKKGSTKCA